MNTWTIGALLDTTTGYLREKGSSSARLDAELLLAESLGVGRIDLYTQHDRPLQPSELDAYRELVARRGKREPVAYILGRSHFRHLCLEVGLAVLIPRPETEELVELALETLRRKPLEIGLRGQDEQQPVIVDVGTGSGAIALSIAQESGSRVLALDVSPDALAVAAANVEALGLSDLVELQQADLLSGVPDASLWMVVANPPYIATGEINGLDPDVRDFEPLLALHAGIDGLDVYRRLLPEAVRALQPGGTILLEVGAGQAAAVADLARQAGLTAIDIHRDLSGKDRIVEASRPGCRVLSLDEVDDDAARSLATALRAGAVIGVPTDTVYGVAAAWNSREGIRRLFVAKGRGENSPVAAIFPSVDYLLDCLPDLDPSAVRVLQTLLPGPYTFVVETNVPRPDLVGTPDSLGVRVPSHPALLAFLDRLATPIAATSANLSGQPDVAGLDEVDLGLLAHCSAALASGAGLKLGGVASTVVDLRPLSEGKEAIILREGAVPAAEVFARLGAG